MTGLPEKQLKGTWVQTEREAHEAWSQFLKLKGSLAASRVMHLFLARMGEHNAVIISQSSLAKILEYDTRTIRRAIAMLRDHYWVEVRQIGGRGDVNAYVINDRVAWTGHRDGICNSLFSATVMAFSDEQPDASQLGNQKQLRKMPRMHAGERQMPTGPGLPAPSEPALPSLEPDLPATGSQGDFEDLINK